MAIGINMLAPNELELLDIELPEKLEADEVLVKVKTGGICGSDVHIYDGSHPIGDYPKIIGHEFAGVVEKTGPGVTSLQKGDKVVVNPLIGCGDCYCCTTLKKPNICRDLKVMGVHMNGGFCTEIVVRESSLHKFERMSWKSAAMVEPFTIASQIVERSRISSEDTVLINGSGAIGLSVLMLVKLLGARAISLDLHDAHLEKATELGADLVLNPLKQDVEKEVWDFTGGGASVMIEAVGFTKTIDNIVKLAAPGARIVLIGFDKKTMNLSPFDVTFNEFEIIGSRLQTNRFDPVISLIESGKIDPEKIVSHVFPYREAAEAFPFVIANPDKVIKAIFEF